MTTGGWVIMIISMSSVIALVSFCYYKVLTTPTSTEETPPDSDAHHDP